MEKEKVYKDIKRMVGISAIQICKKKKIDYYNIMGNKASVKTMEVLRSELIKEFKEILKEVEE